MYKSKIFAEEPSERSESDSLKFTLIVTLCSFLVEIICTFARHHFLGLLAYTVILSIFFLNYFDRYTIRISLGLLVVSVFFDLLWIFLESDVEYQLFSLIGTAMDKLNIPPCNLVSLKQSISLLSF